MQPYIFFMEFYFFTHKSEMKKVDPGTLGAGKSLPYCNSSVSVEIYAI